MTSKQTTKSELQKLKVLSDYTEQWSRRVVKSWKSTREVCQRASASFSTETGVETPLQTQLDASTEFVCRCTENVKDLAQSRYTELNRSYQETVKSKSKELHGKMTYASVEISTAVFATFQDQVNQMDQLVHAVMDFQRQHLEERSDVTDSAIAATGTSRDSLETKKWNASSDENNVELDWDAFDRDLAAMADVVDKMGRPPPSEQQHSSDEVQKLKAQLREVQRENGELMKRAILAEQALALAKRENVETKEQITHSSCDTDDFLAMRHALRNEQLTRLEAEQKLKDAQEEIKAAQFAFKVAKAVANRIADSAEIAQGTLGRCQSEPQFNEPPPPLDGHSPTDIPLHSSDPSKAIVIICRSAILVVIVVVGDASGGVARCDSAFFGEHPTEATAGTVSNPFLESSPPQTELVSELSNPFLLPPQETNEASCDTVAEENFNPFLHNGAAAAQTNETHCSEDIFASTNPFLSAPDESGGVESLDISDASNPFAKSTIPIPDVPTEEKEWNPFLTPSTASNPFLA